MTTLVREGVLKEPTPQPYCRSRYDEVLDYYLFLNQPWQNIRVSCTECDALIALEESDLRQAHYSQSNGFSVLAGPGYWSIWFRGVCPFCNERFNSVPHHQVKDSDVITFVDESTTLDPMVRAIDEIHESLNVPIEVLPKRRYLFRRDQ